MFHRSDPARQRGSANPVDPETHQTAELLASMLSQGANMKFSNPPLWDLAQILTTAKSTSNDLSANITESGNAIPVHIKAILESYQYIFMGTKHILEESSTGIDEEEEISQTMNRSEIPKMDSDHKLQHSYLSRPNDNWLPSTNIKIDYDEIRSNGTAFETSGSEFIIGMFDRKDTFGLHLAQGPVNSVPFTCE
ncbi:hypothetical protein ABW20_dc0102330 [Dactylellina cionopaga]|nr:hypothetical protein ABW20_dc0102330 [Dactylellina cionopaga]